MRTWKVALGLAAVGITSLVLVQVAFMLAKQPKKVPAQTKMTCKDEEEEGEIERLKDLYHYGRRNDLVVKFVPQKMLRPENKDITRLGLTPGYSWKQFDKAFGEMCEKESSAKAVYLVRHGEGIHNVAERELGSEYWETVEALSDKYFDAALNDVGIQQCEVLNKAVRAAMADGLKIDVIIVSPLTRAIETAKYGLAHIWGKVPIYAVELSRERFGKNKCDKRKSVSQLKEEFPEVNFDLFMESEDDNWFTPNRESDEEVDGRIALFYNWLIQTPSSWRSIAVVGHSSYMAHSVQYLGAPYHWPANCELVPLVIKKED